MRALLGLLLTLTIACGDDAATDDTDPGDGPETDMFTPRPPPGPSADGWESAFEEGGVGGVSCDSAEADFDGVPHVTIGTSTLYAGFRQASGNNQNPIVARFDDGEQVWCAEHETEGPDGRAEGVTWDGGDVAYVVYTVVGGGTGLEGHGGWLPSYAPGAISGGGAKVSVVGRVDASSGELLSSTFVIAVLSSGNVNTHRPAGAVTVLEDGSVEFLGASAHKPIDANGRDSMDCTDYPFDSRYRSSADLTELVCADSSNCVSERPCD
jgi:hypothetical protein